jgi:Ca2+-binding RTX toxin-like protein
LTGYAAKAYTTIPTAAAGSTLVAAGLVQSATAAPTYSGTTAQFGYNGATGAVFFDADGAAAVASPVQVAIIGTGLTLTVTDFLIVA